MDQQAGKDIAAYLTNKDIYFEVYTDDHLLSRLTASPNCRQNWTF